MRRRANGFTVLEVLVALVVLSIGLLGIAKLILFASRSNDSAYLRSQATALAYEMLDNMRANRSAATLHAYDTLTSSAATTLSYTCVVLASPCAANKLAAYDVNQWKLRLNASNSSPSLGALPSGAGSVQTSVTTPTTAIITVQWDDTAAQSSFASTSPTTMSVVLETLL